MNTIAAPSPDSRLAREVASFCQQAAPAAQQHRSSFPSSPLWQAVTRAGTTLWLDTGDLEAARKLWTREFQALTTNNTLLNKEVQKGIYDELVPDVAALVRGIEPGLGNTEVVREIAFVLNAVHGLKLVRAFDADVSVELHTDLADDVEASHRCGQRFQAICPERFIVKVPLTAAGLLAARRLAKDGIRVNFTLGFAARQNYLIALLARPAWANVFMGRINAFVADNKLGDGRNAGEKATLASQRVLRRLRKSPGVEVRQIGASMRSGQQCFDLLGLDVFTMPVAAAQEFIASNPPAAELRDRTQADPPVTFATGVDADGDRLDCFWRVAAGFEQAMCKLLATDLDALTPSTLTAFLAEHGARDLFPVFSPTERQALAKDGKIPVYKTWGDKVRKGEAGWDGILTAAALASFAQDQRALDERIERLL